MRGNKKFSILISCNLLKLQRYKEKLEEENFSVFSSPYLHQGRAIKYTRQYKCDALLVILLLLLSPPVFAQSLSKIRERATETPFWSVFPQVLIQERKNPPQLLKQSANDDIGKVISFACNGCHGTDGLLVKPGMPKIKGQMAAKLEQSLLDFKYDRKSSSIMGRISKGFTDTELKKVAWYYSQLKDKD